MVGMYVCELDRPWLDSPFLLQGFYIKDNDDIDTVREICDHVFIDKVVAQNQLTHNFPSASSAVFPSAKIVKPAEQDVGVSRATDETQGDQPVNSEQGKEDFFPGRDLIRYTDTATWSGEVRNARQTILSLYDYIGRFMKSSENGEPLDIGSLKRTVDPMLESVIRNPDACLWWATTKPVGNHSHDSSLRASVLAVVLGRQLGLPKHDLRSLAIGGLMFDIGKLRLSDDILHVDRRLTAKEMSIMQRHVEVGLGILKRCGLSDPDIIDFIAHHHERLDCSGYPKGLGGDIIPTFGRIAGVVDCYNAITSRRKYASSRSPAEAINLLYKLKGVHFHTDLIEEFVQAIGVYPVGALVELSTGEVAVVISQSRTRRLRPIVLVLLDSDKNPAREGHYISLEKIMHSEDGSKLDIVKNLEPNAYGIDPAKIKLK